VRAGVPCNSHHSWFLVFWLFSRCFSSINPSRFSVSEDQQRLFPIFSEPWKLLLLRLLLKKGQKALQFATFRSRLLQHFRVRFHRSRSNTKSSAGSMPCSPWPTRPRRGPYRRRRGWRRSRRRSWPGRSAANWYTPRPNWPGRKAAPTNRPPPCSSASAPHGRPRVLGTGNAESRNQHGMRKGTRAEAHDRIVFLPARARRTDRVPCRAPCTHGRGRDPRNTRRGSNTERKPHQIRYRPGSSF